MAVDPSQITLNENQRRELAELSDETGKPWHALLDDALVNLRGSLKRDTNGEGESCLDVANRMSVVGMATGLPDDLSTNPKYMEGFGE
jgi:hypothetical protein